MSAVIERADALAALVGLWEQGGAYLAVDVDGSVLPRQEIEARMLKAARVACFAAREEPLRLSPASAKKKAAKKEKSDAPSPSPEADAAG